MSQDVNHDRSSHKRPFLSEATPAKRRALDDGQTLKSTEIAGHRITCFVVGGEPRLCLPQLLRLVVDHVDVDAVEAARSRLSVNLSRCDVAQLSALRDAKLLPPSATSCGLVTLSDAARIISCLSELRSDVVDSGRRWAWSPSAFDDVIDHNRKWSQSAADDCERLPVCHSCFGGCSGTLSRRGCVSVRCVECAAVMSPDQFVSHSHRLEAESRGTCHWGFRSAHWRHYVMINSAVTTSPEATRRLQDTLDDVKRLYDDELPAKQVPGCGQVTEVSMLVVHR